MALPAMQSAKSTWPVGYPWVSVDGSHRPCPTESNWECSLLTTLNTSTTAVRAMGNDSRLTIAYNTIFYRVNKLDQSKTLSKKLKGQRAESDSVIQPFVLLPLGFLHTCKGCDGLFHFFPIRHSSFAGMELEYRMDIPYVRRNS